MSFPKPSNLLPRLHGGKEKYTDTNEFLSPGVLIAYKKRPDYPTREMKAAVNAAAIQGRNIVRIANDVLAKVCLQRKNEPAYFTQAMERHFNLKSNGDLGGGLLRNNVVDKPFSLKEVLTHDRRWALDRIRRDMLSLSFHLNTGMYLIDMDNANRDVDGGNTVPAGTANPVTTRGYVFRYAAGKNTLCGFRNGEIHIEFPVFLTHTLNSGARVIVHEACHKFLNVKDTYYAWNVNYPPSLNECLNDNADSFAWLAVSLALGELRMDASGSADGRTCPGAKL